MEMIDFLIFGLLDPALLLGVATATIILNCLKNRIGLTYNWGDL